MSLRTRFAIAFALVAAVVAALVGTLSYRAASERVFAEVDRSLASTTASVQAGQTGVLGATTTLSSGDRDRGDGGDGDRGGHRGPGGHGDGPAFTAQICAPDGTVTAVGGRAVRLPVSEATRSLAAAGVAGGVDTTEVVVGRDDYRVRTTALGGGRGALQVATDVDEVHLVLGGMAVEIAWVSGAVLVAAAVLGWVLARRITRRLTRLTRAAEQVNADGYVEAEIPVEGRDEVGRLSASFTTMLGRLAAAREAQDRLVQDAAHELRTPLTSLRTNASVLRRFDELPPAARDRLVDDLQGETRELSHLVDELVELALARHGEEAEEDVDLAALAHRAADRVERRTGRRVHVDADGVAVRGRPQALDRAIGNLLENAAKFDAGGAEPVALEIRGGRVTVTDRGPGIDAADTARVFDRFYRADTARGLPGSGLGLAIVRDVAEHHDGTVLVSTPPGGGVTVGFTIAEARFLPASEPDHDEVSPGSATVGNT